MISWLYHTWHPKMQLIFPNCSKAPIKGRKKARRIVDNFAETDRLLSERVKKDASRSDGSIKKWSPIGDRPRRGNKGRNSVIFPPNKWPVRAIRTLDNPARRSDRRLGFVSKDEEISWLGRCFSRAVDRYFPSRRPHPFSRGYLLPPSRRRVSRIPYLLVVFSMNSRDTLVWRNKRYVVVMIP